MTISKPQLQRLSVDADVPLMCKLLEEDGAFILKSALSLDIVESFNRELDVQMAIPPTKGERLLANAYPPHFKYVPNLPTTCGTFRNVILNNPVLHAICEAYFEHTGDYWLSTAFMRSIDAGMPAQGWHRDDATHPLMHYQPMDAPPISLSVIFPLTKFTEENGATEIILGSHRWDEVGTPSHDQAVLATMDPGDILVLRQRVVHAGGPNNTTDEDPRRVVLAYFNSCQLTPFETYRTMPLEMVESMTPLAQRMLGWWTMKPADPNIVGINITDDKRLEKVLQLKSNQ
ncbi:verruculogen synthase [Penicillium mononematosum]|uniref:verruculogen synthase n=1 Tax=Penicillium mononematosum TaxID=268346 RepID=UPI0025483C7C|nr:verruculogen synthase [Penicillium mononematosum]KAJ6190249.1 verruculogen synthase [Penicillium mononematosum]